MKQDLQGFSNARLEELKKLEKMWGNKKMKENLMKYNLQNERFYEGSCKEAVLLIPTE